MQTSAMAKPFGAAKQIRAVKVGDAAPKISLKDQSGRSVSLPSKKPTVLFFYPKAASPGCTRQAKAFGDSYAELKKLGADVYGVSSDTVDAQGAFASSLGLPFPLLADEGAAARAAYGIKADLFGLLPGRQTFVIGKDGTVKLSFNDQTNPEKHAEKALEAVAAEGAAAKKAGPFSFFG